MSINIPTPNELDSIQQSQDDAVFRKVVDYIVKTLDREYVTGSAVDMTISVSLVNGRIIQRVIREFDEKNWIVHFGNVQSDQREDNFYNVRIQAKAGR